MARTSEELTKVSLPKNLPEGLEIIQAERTLSGVKETVTGDDGKERQVSPKEVVSVLVPCEGSKVGLLAWIELRSKLGGKAADGELGTHDVVNAIRSEAFNIVPKLTRDQVADSASYLLPFSGPRVIDPFEVATAKIGAFQRVKGRMPTAEEYAAIMASVTS